MTETEFNQNVDNVLLKLERSIESASADIDFELSEGILEIDFPDGSKIIINRQAFNREIWVAARSGGYHFTWDGNQWLSNREQRELFDLLSECVSVQSGEKIIFQP